MVLVATWPRAEVDELHAFTAKEIIFKIRKKSTGNALKLKPLLNALYFVTCLCWPWTRFHRFHVLLQILFGPPPRG